MLYRCASVLHVTRYTASTSRGPARSNVTLKMHRKNLPQSVQTAFAVIRTSRLLSGRFPVLTEPSSKRRPDPIYDPNRPSSTRSDTTFLSIGPHRVTSAVRRLSVLVELLYTGLGSTAVLHRRPRVNIAHHNRIVALAQNDSVFFFRESLFLFSEWRVSFLRQT